MFVNASQWFRWLGLSRRVVPVDAVGDAGCGRLTAVDFWATRVAEQHARRLWVAAQTADTVKVVQSCQFTHCKPATRENSRTLRVTSVA